MTLTQETTGYTIDAGIAFKDVKPEEYLGIFFSGGRAPEYIRYAEDLMRITRYFLRRTNRLRASAMGSKFPVGRALQMGAGWPRWRGAASISRYAEAPTWISPVSSTVIW